jgi:hypothetical protein
VRASRRSSPAPLATAGYDSAAGGSIVGGVDSDTPGAKTKVKRLKQETRHWSSGLVRLSVIGIEDHPEDNYIVLEKSFTGKLPHNDQRFNLRERDWNALKRLVDGPLPDEGLAMAAQWTPPTISDEELARLAGTRPELIEVILSAPNLGQFSEPSLQSLDRLANKIGDLKAEQLELILDRLAAATAPGLKDFGQLLRDLQLEQIASLARLVHQKLKTLDALENGSPPIPARLSAPSTRSLT